MSNLGENIKKLRLSRGMTQQQLADVVNVKSYTTVTKWESGDNSPRGGELVSLSNLFNVSVDELLGLERITLPSNEYNYFPIGVSAGLPENIESVNAEKINIPDSIMGKWAGQSDIMIMRVNGQSMNKTIPDQSLMAVKPIELSNLKNDDIVVYSDNHDYSVKRYYDDVENERIIFRPHSTDRIFIDDIYYYDNLDSIKIHGKVVLYIVELD
ncbi:MAG TPA: XRE family transcriptional regulator [Candidatus Sphingobacterium stercoripullorum]|uniref:XRE family transcriptional regulator n=1 Tax=Candidatus Sphingobacterium stercoripullorum TaxID=2838759 RepID=A0A9D2AYR4_9SPHI|nr:XRE family transcriptional regulator [Candidatus Sphingobacterium stercoripullorum]